MRDPRLPAGMGKAGACLVALRTLLVRIVQVGPNAELQLSSRFCRGRALCPPMPFCVGIGVKEDVELSY